MSVRRAFRAAPERAGAVSVGELHALTDWRAALDVADHVIYFAGPAHGRLRQGDLSAFIVDARAALARQASAAGVRRLIYVSSIKAAAARTRRAVSERDAPAPEDSYGRAKLAAEAAVAGETEAVILRPPLVHGPGAKANFAKLMWLADTPLPLPFKGLRNRRSTIALSTLIQAIASVLKRPDGPTGVHHVADQAALSTGAMIAALRKGCGRRNNLFFAPALARLAPGVMTESLEIDDAAFRAAYGYGARGAVEARAALTETASAWKARR